MTCQFARVYMEADDLYSTIRQHVLFQELGIKKSRNDCPVLLTVPQSWTKEQLERLVQIFFENFNAPGVYIATQPLMALYGCGVVTGLVVDIGHNTTNVSIAVDSCLQLQCNFSSPVAGKELTAYMFRSMQEDEVLNNEFKKHSEESGEEIKLDEEFARYVKELPGVCNVLVGHEIEENLLSVEIPASIVSTPSAAKEDTPAAVDAVEEQDALKKIPDREEIEYKGKKVTACT
jgi:Actin